MLEGPFRGSTAVARGLVTKRVLRGPGYYRIFPDIYVAAGAPLTLEVWSRAAALLVSHRGGAAAGYSAAALLGADCARRDAPAEVVVPAGGLRARPGLRVHREVLDTDDILVRNGFPVTSPVRTAWDLCRREGLVDAVVALDAVARVGRFDPDLVVARSRERPGARGCRELDRVVSLADARSESPMETRLRLLLVLGGLPVPEVQYRIVDEHGFVLARADLAYPEERLAIEYDGRSHFDSPRARRDRRRDLDVADLGWHTMRFVDDDVLASPPQTVDLVRRMLAARRPRRSSVAPGSSRSGRTTLV